MQALGDRAHRHHADAHQILLQFAVQARLRGQRSVRLVGHLDQALLHGGYVVDAFGHHARQFLEAREAVELESVELLFGFLHDLHARGELRFGGDLDLAQLASQPGDVLGQLHQRALQCVHLGFDA